MITTEQIKQLRSETGLSISECKKALEETSGNIEKAREVLRSKGAEVVQKKAGRDLKAGTVATYVHNDGSVGAMVELSSETDFVAKNEEFKTLAYNLAMQAAAMADDGESVEKADKDKFLQLPYIKDESKKVNDLIEEAVQKFGERIEVARVARFSTR